MKTPDAGGKWRCNIWQGEFPWKNTLADGYAANLAGEDVSARTATGCTTWPGMSGSGAATGTGRSPTSRARDEPNRPGTEFRPDRSEPDWYPSACSAAGRSCAATDSVRGTSLTAAARGEIDTGQSHVGFRCAKDAK